MKKTRTQRQQERRHEFDALERQRWDEFYKSLSGAQNYLDAQVLISKAPPPDAPGRRYYSNLSFFLQYLVRPHGASDAEWALYIQLLRRMDAAGDLKPGVREKFERELKRESEEDGA